MKITSFRTGTDIQVSKLTKSFDSKDWEIEYEKGDFFVYITEKTPSFGEKPRSFGLTVFNIASFQFETGAEILPAQKVENGETLSGTVSSEMPKKAGRPRKE